MVSFPGLNVSFDITPVAFQAFGINIYYYAICMIFAIVISVILCYKSQEKFNVKFDFVFESLIYAIIWGFVGARIYYVLFNFDKYKNLMQILNFRDGGLAIYGGLIFGAFLIVKRCKKYKVNILDFFDYFVPFVAIGQAIGRWGNFFNIEAYGIETDNIFRMGINTESGYQEVHPTFLYESICCLVIFIMLRLLQKHRKFKGEIFYVYLFLYSGARMIIEGIRIDSLMLNNFRISQILSIAIFVVSGIMLLKNYIKYIYNNKNY